MNPSPHDRAVGALFPAPLPWGLAASMGLHLGAALLALLQLPLNHILPPLEPPSIAVEMISPEAFAALAPRHPEPPATSPAVPEAAQQRSPTTPTADDRTVASTFYAGNLLAEPASSNLRRAMETLDRRERLVQLCDIEAMAQVRQARPEFDPDMVVAYASAETEMRGGQLVAEGAAFRSRREWYGLSFACEGRPDYSGVVSFSFTVGAFIPHELWDGYTLTAEETGD